MSKETDKIYDLAIIGGGPAGTAAGVYASRKKLKTIFITESFGGQSVVSEGIENWIGEIKISGLDLANKFEDHLKAYAGDVVDIKKGERVEEIKEETDRETNHFFTVKTEKGDVFTAKTVLITAGSRRRKLKVPGSVEFENKGLMYCATCDGPIFAGKDVAVIGGGNSAFEGVLQLLNYCNKVYLIHRRGEFKADPVTVETAKQNPKLELILESEVTEILGDKMLNGLKYKNNKTGEEKQLDVEGVFVEIGAIAAVSIAEGLVDLAKDGTIAVDPWTQRTSVDGVWAAGDVTNGKYHQNNIAAGDAVKALEDIYVWLKAQETNKS